MTDAIVNEVLRLIQQLDSEERLKLIAFLQATLADSPNANNPEIPNSLFGKHANPQSTVSADELDAYLHEVATEWEGDFVDWPMLDVEVLSDDLKLRREDFYDDKPLELGDFRTARGVFGWSDGDEPAEVTIRRLQDDF